MAPAVKRTYSRNKSIVNVFDVMKMNTFSQKSSRIRKAKVRIKELPPRTENLLRADSFNASTDDTFDKICKGNIYNKVNFTNSSKINSSQSDISTKSTLVIKQSFNYYSPILTRRRKKKLDEIFSQSSLFNSTPDLKPVEKSVAHLKESTAEIIENSLEIEKVQNKPESSSLSYIKLPEIKEGEISSFRTMNIDENTSCDPIFTESLRERVMVHSSTPLPVKSRFLIKHGISPIKNEQRNKKVFTRKAKISEKSKETLKNCEDENFKGFTYAEQNARNNTIEIFSNYISDLEQSLNESFSHFSKQKTKGFLGFTDAEKSMDKSTEVLALSHKICGIDESINSFGSIYIKNKEPPELNYLSKIKKSTEERTHHIIPSKLKNSSLSLTDTSLKNYEGSKNFVTWRRRTKNYHQGSHYTFTKNDNTTDSYIERIERNSDNITKKRGRLSNSDNNTETLALQGIKITPLVNLTRPRLIVNLTRLRVSHLLKETPKETALDHQVSLEDLEEIHSNNPKEKEIVSPNHSATNNINETNQKREESNITASKNQSVSVKKASPNKKLKELIVKLRRDTINKLELSAQKSVEPSVKLSDIVEKEIVSPNYSATIDINETNQNREESNITASKNQSVSVEKDSPNKNLKELIVKLRRGTIEKLELSAQKSVEPSAKLSDIVENSLNSSELTDNFQIPTSINGRKTKSKILRLKSGKLFRRSLSIYRRCSLMDNILTQKPCLLNDGSFCKCSKCYPNVSLRRQSIRIVPTTQSSDKKISILESYAHTISIVEETLEDSAEGLVVQNNRKSILKNINVAVTAREIVLKRCGQDNPLDFNECYPASLLENCHKIGEGVYGEVFLRKNVTGGPTVMKVIPIEGNQIVNGERQKKFEEIISEIIIAMELSELRNKKTNCTSSFSEVQKIRCVQGKYPARLLELWELYDETKGSENDSPDIFMDDQLYVVLELANGGHDLEAFVFNNSVQAYSMFSQVACSLAVAENELQFEHRDLHWGNVLLTDVDKNKNVSYKLHGKNIEIETKGVQIAIIDFTLSRIEHEGVVIFNDLSQDPDLFKAEGDYQFEIYRLMQKKNGDNWQYFEPFTNVLWLHYVLDKAITALRYKNPTSKLHKDYISKLKNAKKDILNYCSVTDFVNSYFI